MANPPGLYEVLVFSFIVFSFIVIFVEPNTLKKHLHQTPSASCWCCSNLVVDLPNPPGDTNPNTSVKHQHQQQQTPTKCLVAHTEQIAETFTIVPPPLSQRAPWPALRCDTLSFALSCAGLSGARRRSMGYARDFEYFSFLLIVLTERPTWMLLLG